MKGRDISNKNREVILKVIISANIDLHNELKTSLKHLSALETNMVLLSKLGYSLTEIRTVLNISMKRIKNILENNDT